MSSGSPEKGPYLISSHLSPLTPFRELSMQTETGFDFIKLEEQAKTRWLKPIEVLYILKNHEMFQMTHKSPQLPPSGSLFLFNKRVLRYFRNDGYLWRKKPNGKTVLEGHERLKVGGVEAINCYYARGEQNSCLQRRSYWMLDPGFEHIVLVHYREVVEERCIPESYLSVSNGYFPNSSQSFSSPDAQVQDVPSQTTGLNDPGQSTSSPGSLEVSSEFANEQFEILQQTAVCENNSQSLSPEAATSENNSQSLSPEVNEALRKLKMQLSLNDDDDNVSGGDDDTYFEEKEFPGSFVNEEPQDVQVLNLEMRGSYEEPLNNIFDENKYTLDGHADAGFQCEAMLTGPACSTWFHEDSDFLQTIRRNSCGINSCTLTQEIDKPILPAENGICSFRHDVCLDHQKLDVSSVQESTTTSAQMQCFIIHEVSPEWAFSYESTKVIITGQFLCDPSEHQWTVLFGDVEVPLEIVHDGVFRCKSPMHSAGKVNLCVTSGKGEFRSQVREFEFREKLHNTRNFGTTQIDTNKETEEMLLLIKLVKILLDVDTSESVSREINYIPDLDPHRRVRENEDQLVMITKELAGSAPTIKIMDLLVQELLKDKIWYWLSSKHHNNADNCFLSRKEQCIIHMISGLGYKWALRPILGSGVGINFRDPDGWSALHWAAYFGREETIVELLALGASAGALTDPTSEDPTGKTPAHIAFERGHKGLAAYLSEAALTSHFFSLETERNGTLRHSSSMNENSGVESISKRSAHLHGASEDQLSLKDSLAAVRNAAQAAARIQSAFRAYSFKLKHLKATAEDMHNWSLNDIHGLSAATKLLKGFHDLRDQAALSIQKNYRCWKTRSQFLILRKRVVKIQAHVRSHLARKKYQFLLTVGVIEKIVLRWHRKGVGLRRFQTENVSMDDEGEDDALKVFHKQAVETAIDEALSRVKSLIESPEARQQYRRMLESYQQAKAMSSHSSDRS